MLRTLRAAWLVAPYFRQPLGEGEDFTRQPNCQKYVSQQTRCPRQLTSLLLLACPTQAGLVGIGRHFVPSSAGPSAQRERVSPPARNGETLLYSLMPTPGVARGSPPPLGGQASEGTYPPRFSRLNQSAAAFFTTEPKSSTQLKVNISALLVEYNIAHRNISYHRFPASRAAATTETTR